MHKFRRIGENIYFYKNGMGKKNTHTLYDNCAFTLYIFWLIGILRLNMETVSFILVSFIVENCMLFKIYNEKKISFCKFSSHPI